MRVAGLLFFVLFSAGCGLLGPRREVSPPPTWIASPPVTDGYIYAIGQFVGALYPEDNLKYALEDARAKLADRLRAYVESASEVRIRGQDERFRSDTRIETRGELKNIEHVASWTDVDGTCGPKGQEWVLVRTAMLH